MSHAAARAFNISASASIALIGVAGCGGGGGGHVPALTPPTTASTPPKSPAGHGNVSFSFAIPRGKTSSARRRTPSFISPGAVSVSVVINGTQTDTYDVGVGKPGCVANGSTEVDCVVSAQAPTGSDSFDVKLYDATGATGHLLSEGTATSYIDGSPQQIAVTMNPYVASIALALPQPPDGDCGVGQLDTSNPLPLTVSAYDPSGALITPPGAFQNPITLTNSDTSGAATLSQTTIADTTVAPTLTYTGIDYTVPITINATANGVATAQITPATLNLGADRPLSNRSQSIYSVTSPTLTAATETMTVFANATYPTTPYPNAVTIPAQPSRLCRIHIVNPTISDANRDSGDNTLAYVFFLAPNEMQNDDVYVTTQAGGGATSTLMWLSQSTDWQHNTGSGAVVNVGPTITLFNTPSTLGVLPRPSSLSIQQSWDTYWEDTLNAYLSDGTLTTEDFVHEIQHANGVDTFRGFTAIPSGSSLSGSSSSSQSSSPPLIVTDLGVETIPAVCAVGPGIPTQAVHLTYTGGIGYLDRQRLPQGQRGTSVLRPSNAAGTTDEWIRRDVGVVCRRQSKNFGSVAALQSFGPVPTR